MPITLWNVLAVAPSQGEADLPADAVLSAGLANNALALRKKNGNNGDTAVIFTGGSVSERLSNAARNDSQ